MMPYLDSAFNQMKVLKSVDLKLCICFYMMCFTSQCCCILRQRSLAKMIGIINKFIQYVRIPFDKGLPSLSKDAATPIYETCSVKVSTHYMVPSRAYLKDFHRTALYMIFLLTPLFFILAQNLAEPN